MVADYLNELEKVKAEVEDMEAKVKEDKYQTTKALLDSKVDINIIMNATCLSKEEIEKI